MVILSTILTMINLFFIILLCSIVVHFFNRYKDDQKKFRKFLKLDIKFKKFIGEYIENSYNHFENKKSEKQINSPDDIAALVLLKISNDDEIDINYIHISNMPLSLFLCIHCSDKYVYKMVEKGLDLNKTVLVTTDRDDNKTPIFPLRFLIDAQRLNVIKKLHKENKINININIEEDTSSYEYCIRTDNYDIAEYIQQNSNLSIPLMNKKSLN